MYLCMYVDMYVCTAGQRAYVAMTKKTYHVQNPTTSVWPTIRFKSPLHETSCARFKNLSNWGTTIIFVIFNVFRIYLSMRSLTLLWLGLEIKVQRLLVICRVIFPFLEWYVPIHVETQYILGHGGQSRCPAIGIHRVMYGTYIRGLRSGSQRGTSLSKMIVR